MAPVPGAGRQLTARRLRPDWAEFACCRSERRLRAERAARSPMSASLIGRSGSSTFRLSTLQCVDVARGLALLFGLGTKALPVWDSKTRWNNLWGDLAVRLTVGSSGRANSPHPSSREGHHSTTQWSSSFLLIID